VKAVVIIIMFRLCVVLDWVNMGWELCGRLCRGH